MCCPILNRHYDAVRDVYANLAAPKMKNLGVLLQSNVEVRTPYVRLSQALHAGIDC